METKRRFTLVIEGDPPTVDPNSPLSDSVMLMDGGHEAYSRMRELMYRLAPLLEEYSVPALLVISDGDNAEYVGDAPIAVEEPLPFEQWRATFVNGVHNQDDPAVAFMSVTMGEPLWPRIPQGTIVRTYAAGLGRWFSEQTYCWQCVTNEFVEGDLARCESMLYVHYVDTFLEYISGTESGNA